MYIVETGVPQRKSASYATDDITWYNKDIRQTSRQTFYVHSPHCAWASRGKNRCEQRKVHCMQVNGEKRFTIQQRFGG